MIHPGENTFKTDYQFCGLTRASCAELFDCTERTIGNWERKGAPGYAKKFLLLYEGKLDFFGKAWKGFRITPDSLKSPEGEHVYPGEVRALKYLYQAAKVDRYELCGKLDDHGVLRVQLKKYEKAKPLVHLLPQEELQKLITQQ